MLRYGDPYLKYTYNLSDEDVVEGWVENPYHQCFSGMKFFEHEALIDCGHGLPGSWVFWSG